MKSDKLNRHRRARRKHDELLRQANGYAKVTNKEELIQRLKQLRDQDAKI